MYDIVKRIFLKFCIGLHQESVPNIIDITADDEIPSVRIPDEACTSLFFKSEMPGIKYHSRVSCFLLLMKILIS